MKERLMRDFAVHTLAMLAGTAFILYVMAGLVLAVWNGLLGLIAFGGGHRSGPYRSDRSSHELYERTLRDAHRR